MIKEVFLKLLSKIFLGVTLLRNYLYDHRFLDRYRSKLRVISVGNISVGGTGKTPLCLHIAKILKDQNRKPVILSRGYGGNIKGPHLVSKTDDGKTCGDEAILMAKKGIAPVVIARSRSKGAQFIEKENLGDVIILDDGLQHRKLFRNVNIVSINVTEDAVVDSFVKGTLLPYGYLREDRERALKRASYIVLSQRRPAALMQPPPDALLKLLPLGVPVFLSSFEPGAVNELKGEKVLAPCEVVAFCAIANPQSFLDTLKSAGFKIKESFLFRDHHVFSSSEIAEIKNKAGGLPLVCTEKDAVRLLDSQMEGVFALQGKVVVLPQDDFSKVLAAV